MNFRYICKSNCRTVNMDMNAKPDRQQKTKIANTTAGNQSSWTLLDK